MMARPSASSTVDGGDRTRIAFVRDQAGKVLGAVLNPGNGSRRACGSSSRTEVAAKEKPGPRGPGFSSFRARDRREPGSITTTGVWIPGLRKRRIPEMTTGFLIDELTPSRSARASGDAVHIGLLAAFLARSRAWSRSSSSSTFFSSSNASASRLRASSSWIPQLVGGAGQVLAALDRGLG